jgi:hypothetical protein
MKTRFWIGMLVTIFLLMVGISSAWIFQVNAASPLRNQVPEGGSPSEAWILNYISTDPSAGSHASMAIDEDNDNAPWIAYFNDEDRCLMVARYVGAGNGDCNADDAWRCVQVDYVEGETRGLHTSIDIHPDTNPDPLLSNWRVGVSYYDYTHKSLKYATYKCNLGICQWSIDTVDSSGDGADTVGKWTSIKYTADGVAVISYYAYDDMGDFRMEMLKYAYWVGSGSGNCGDDANWQCSIVDSVYVSAGGVNYGAYSSLDLNEEDNSFISYYDGNNGDLKFAYYQGFGGSCSNAEWNCPVIDDGDGDDVGLFTSIHAPDDTDDMLRVAYYDKTAGTLKYAWDIGSSGNCGTGGTSWQCNVIDEVGVDEAQLGISLAVGPDGQSMIAYADDESAQMPLILKVASPAYFELYANCGGELLYDWYCRVVDEAGWDVIEAYDVALAIKPDGMAIIAYSEYDERYPPDGYNLKIAYQGYKTVIPLVSKVTP